MPKPPKVGARRYLNDLDHEIMLDDAAELAQAEADYERWLAGERTSVEGYDEPDPAYNPADPDDRLERERGRL